MISVILLNYNNAKDTITCINSLLDVKPNDFSIVLVDNASTDNSVTEIENALKKIEKEIIFIKNSNNDGFAGGNRVGAEYAINELKSEYVVLLNNDTTVESDFLTPLVDVYRQKSDAGLVGGIIYNQGDRSVWFAGGDSFWYKEGVHRLEVPSDEITKSDFITGCLMVIPASLIKEIGFMDERYFLYVEDSDYSKSVRESGYTNYITSKSRIYHASGSSTGGDFAPFSYYYGTRNRLFYHYKHYNKLDFLLFFLLFSSIKVLRALQFSIQKKPQTTKAMLRGIVDFFKMRREL